MDIIKMFLKSLIFLAVLSAIYGCQAIPPYSEFEMSKEKGTATIELSENTPTGIFIFPRANCNVGNFADSRKIEVEADQEFAFSVLFLQDVSARSVTSCNVWSLFVPKKGENYIFGMESDSKEGKCWSYVYRKEPSGRLVVEESFIKAQRDMSFFRDGPFCKVLPANK